MKLDFFFFRCTRINDAFQFHSRMHLVIICIYLFCNPFCVLKTEILHFSEFDKNQWVLNRKEGKLYLRVYKMVACFEKPVIQSKQLWLMSQGLQGTICSHVCLFVFNSWGKIYHSENVIFHLCTSKNRCEVGIIQQMWRSISPSDCFQPVVWSWNHCAMQKKEKQRTERRQRVPLV